MPDRHLVADLGVEAISSHVKNCSILDVAASADADRIHVAS